ncbi:Uncharacterised protein [Moraxella ovis]|nr:Uncharacterised protein [Moraxella ovis]
MKFTLNQLHSLLGKRVCFNTVCELGKQQITGKVIGLPFIKIKDMIWW